MTDKEADIRALEADLTDALGMKVTLQPADGDIEVRITCRTLPNLDDVCRRLTIRLVEDPPPAPSPIERGLRLVWSKKDE